MALWDIGRAGFRPPLWRVLGGTDPRVKVYAGGIA